MGSDKGKPQDEPQDEPQGTTEDQVEDGVRSGSRDRSEESGPQVVEPEGAEAAAPAEPVSERSDGVGAEAGTDVSRTAAEESEGDAPGVATDGTAEAAEADGGAEPTVTASDVVPPGERGGEPAGPSDVPPGAEPSPEPPSGWKRVAQLMRPRGTRAELLTGLLCLALGFALAVQVGQSTGDQLSSLRQDELVRLLDEVTQRAEQLDAEVADLEQIRDDLRSEDGRDQAARDLARQRAEDEGILSGRLPAHGPGVQIRVADGDRPLEAQLLFNLLEELRNAGAEAIQVNGVRLVTTSYFVDSGGGVVLDGAAVSSPYEWTAIGDPETIDRALEIPGGALPRIREEGGEAATTPVDEARVDAVRIPGEPEYAEPVDEE